MPEKLTVFILVFVDLDIDMGKVTRGAKVQNRYRGLWFFGGEKWFLVGSTVNEPLK